METTKYIESGILELYVFGKLTATEESEVLQNVAQYPEIKKELTRIEVAFEQYALSKGITPPAGTLTGILRQVGMSTPTPAIAAGKTSIASYLLAALSAVSLLGAYYFYSQSNQKATLVSEKTEEFATLKTDCDAVKKLNLELKEELKIRGNANNKNILLNPAGKYENKPNPAFAAVYYNTTEQLAWLDTQKMSPPPAGKQYQLWAIVDGKPVDMGVFDLTVDKDTSLQTIPYIPEAQAFAVTVENIGGVESPTLTEMIVVGNVG